MKSKLSLANASIIPALFETVTCPEIPPLEALVRLLISSLRACDEMPILVGEIMWNPYIIRMGLFNPVHHCPSKIHLSWHTGTHTHIYIYSIRKTTLPPCFGRSFLGHCISCNPFPLTAVTSTSMAPQFIKRSNMFHPFNGECHISHWICWREILQDNPMFK